MTFPPSTSLRSAPPPHFVRWRIGGGAALILSPGQGERWHAKRDGGGCFLPLKGFP
jgi:hypothetical protein